jgi:hypothetical protein
MIKARPKYSTNLYGTIYIDNIQKAVVIFLIIMTIFPFDIKDMSKIVTKQKDLNFDRRKTLRK